MRRVARIALIRDNGVMAKTGLTDLEYQVADVVTIVMECWPTQADWSPSELARKAQTRKVREGAASLDRLDPFEVPSEPEVRRCIHGVLQWMVASSYLKTN